MKTIIIVLIIIIVGAGVYQFVFNSNTIQDTGPLNIPLPDLGPAPDLVFTDFNGKEVQFSDFRGKIVIANTWAAWCPFCREELPDFVTLQKEYPDDIVVVAIDRAESESKAREYTDSLNITNDLVYVLDPGDDFYNAIGGFSMPETLFIDAEGVVRIHKRGVMDLSEMRKKLNQML